MLSEKLGKLEFWTFIIGFHMTFFVQHFLGLIGMQRRVFTYLPNQGFDLMNLISTIGAFLMGVGVIVFLINIGITAANRITSYNVCYTKLLRNHCTALMLTYTARRFFHCS